ncbi:MAG: metallophosphoesterase family protein [Caldilineaceae bacterium]
MRIAVLTDIHGNLPAFEAVLEDVAQRQADLIVIGGDVVNGAPDSAACWQLARSLNCPLIFGNHEGYVVDYGTPRANPNSELPQFAPVRWAAAQCSAAQKQAMLELPRSFCLAEAPELLFVHASLRSDRDTIAAHTPAADFTDMFPNVNATIIVRGHNHFSQVRMWGERLILTAGAIGLHQGEPRAAQYVLLERQQTGWTFEHRSVTYAVDRALRRFVETGYLEATGVAGRLFQREIATSTMQWVPFLRLYNAAIQAGELTLEDAFERFQRL